MYLVEDTDKICFLFLFHVARNSFNKHIVYIDKFVKFSDNFNKNLHKITLALFCSY